MEPEQRFEDLALPVHASLPSHNTQCLLDVEHGGSMIHRPEMYVPFPHRSQLDDTADFDLVSLQVIVAFGASGTRADEPEIVL
jgi:hypothetical protein